MLARGRILLLLLLHLLIGLSGHQAWASNTAEKYIVQFKRGVPTSVRSQVLAQLYIDERRVALFNNIFMGFATKLTQADVTWLNTHPAIQLVRMEGRSRKMGYIRQQRAPWGLARISSRNPGQDFFAYDQTAGAGTCAYVLDTGVDETHPDFGGRAQHVENYVLDEHRYDDDGHGTHVAGILGSTTYGVAKATRILDVKILDADGIGVESSMLQGLELITWHASSTRCPKGIVVCMSLEGDYSPLVNMGVATLSQMGIFVGAAAGNSNEAAGSTSPASDPSVCVVGGTDADDAPMMKITDPYVPDDKIVATNYGVRVDLLAPAAGIESTASGGGTEFKWGTSQATPHVVGIAALEMARGNAARARALCVHLREMSTKDAIRNLQPNTANRLAFSGETGIGSASRSGSGRGGGRGIFSALASDLCRPRSSRSRSRGRGSGIDTPPSRGRSPSPCVLRPNPYFEIVPGDPIPACPVVSNLLVSFEIASGGLVENRFQLEFSGTGANNPYTLQADNGVWHRLDMRAVFGARTVPMNRLQSFTVSSTARTTCNFLDNSQWSIRALKVRIRCGTSDLWLQNEKFTTRLKRVQPGACYSQALVRGEPPNWLPRPICSHLRSMRVFIKIADVPHAGTNNDLMLNLGGMNVRLARGPVRNEVYDLYVSMQKAFATPFVSAQHGFRVSVLNLGNGGAFFPEEMIIKAACYGVHSSYVQVKSRNTRWIPTGGQWAVDVTPDMWQATAS